MTPSTSETERVTAGDNDGRTLRLFAGRVDHRIAWLTALAITIHVAESALPTPLPGVKPGLANLVTVAALLLYGWRTAAWISLLRVLIGSLLLGTFLSPAFLLSLSGSLCALVAMGAARLTPFHIGATGYSVLAALAHMAGQAGVVYLVFLPHQAILQLMPVLLTAALFFGLVNGIITQRAIMRLRP